MWDFKICIYFNWNYGKVGWYIVIKLAVYFKCYWNKHACGRNTTRMLQTWKPCFMAFKFLYQISACSVGWDQTRGPNVHLGTQCNHSSAPIWTDKGRARVFSFGHRWWLSYGGEIKFLSGMSQELNGVHRKHIVRLAGELMRTCFMPNIPPVQSYDVFFSHCGKLIIAFNVSVTCTVLDVCQHLHNG